jgi:cytochrome b pre-mRNA-processing protein 3
MFNNFLNEQFATINERKIIYNILFMSEKYLYIYNNLISFTRNKDLYKSLIEMTIFLTV